MRRRWISYSLIAALLVSFWSLNIGFANDNDDAQKRLDEINSEKSGIEADLQAGKKKVKDLNAQISELENAIKTTEGDITKLGREIESTKWEIEKQRLNMEKVQAEMDDQNDQMDQRLRMMYMQGEMGILEILLGSENIAELLTNLDMIRYIYEDDVALLQEMQNQHEVIATEKKQLEELEAKLEQQQKDEENRKAALAASAGEVDALKAEVQKDNKALEAMIDAFNKEAANLEAQIRGLTDSNLEFTGGTLSPPVASIRVTSEYGYRIHPILKQNKLHTGIDFAASTGTTIMAAADGKVIMAGWNNSYGNVVMIDHGSNLVTLYAHNSSLSVSVGDWVTRGQKIAAAGSTGMSTGPHCHFEVRKNGVTQNPRILLSGA